MSGVARMNDRLFRRAAAKKFTLLRQFPRCVHAQHKIYRSALGSFLLFAALTMIVRWSDTCQSRYYPKQLCPPTKFRQHRVLNTVFPPHCR